MRLVQGMYANARSLVHVGQSFSQEYEVKVGVGIRTQSLALHH